MNLCKNDRALIVPLIFQNPKAQAESVEVGSPEPLTTSSLWMRSGVTDGRWAYEQKPSI